MNKTDKIVGVGVSWTTVLVMIFIVLKVMGLTDISWLWVFSPWWLSFALGLFLISLIAVLAFLLDNK